MMFKLISQLLLLVLSSNALPIPPSLHKIQIDISNNTLNGDQTNSVSMSGSSGTITMEINKAGVNQDNTVTATGSVDAIEISRNKSGGNKKNTISVDLHVSNPQKMN